MMMKGLINMLKNNLQENCPYFDREVRKCTRKGCHLLCPCIAKISEDNFHKVFLNLKTIKE